MPAKRSYLQGDTREPTGVSLGKLNDFLGFRMRRLQNQLAKNFSDATADRNLRSGLLSSLAIISANPGVSQTEVARAVGLDKSVFVLIVDDLEREGWAVRERSTVDRRRHALRITPAGEAYLGSLIAILKDVESVVSRSLSRAEIGLLHELLDRIHSRLELDAGAALL